MNFESKLYKSANLNPFILDQLIDDYVPGDSYSYFLIDDKLVPISLIVRIHDHLLGITFEYVYVWPVEDLLGEELWSSLDAFEKSVAGSCVLILIENGYSVTVPEEFQYKH